MKREEVKQLLQIKAEDNDNQQPVLCLKAGENHCSFAIIDRSTHTLKSLVYYTAEKVTESRLDALLTAHPELTGPFNSICIGYDYHQAMLMPVHHPAPPKEWMHAVYGNNGSASVMLTDQVTGRKLQNAFYVPAKIHEWMSTHFRRATFFHEYSIVPAMRETEGKNYLLADFQHEDFVLSVIKDNQLVLAQAYYYSTPEDVLYHLLKVCGEFALSQQEVQLQISGLVDKQSALYKELYQYFIHISFREPTWKAPSHEYPSHFFTSLNDLALCAS